MSHQGWSEYHVVEGVPDSVDALALGAVLLLSALLDPNLAGKFNVFRGEDTAFLVVIGTPDTDRKFFGMYPPKSPQSSALGAQAGSESRS